MRSLAGQGILKFIFPNILLPDSNVSEAASHGFASFRLKPRDPKLPGTVIENTANIFFDYNDPVITEPSVLVAEFSTEVSAQERGDVHVVPNPATERITIAAFDSAVDFVRIIAADGRTVMTKAVRADRSVMDISHLDSGWYVLLAEGSSGRTGRYPFIKQ